MLYSPKRQRILNFPKYGQKVNQTAKRRNLSIQSNRQRSNRKIQFQFNANDQTFELKRNSLYGEANLQKTEIKNLYTLNPQQQLDIHSDVFNHNKNIGRKYLIKRQRCNFSSLEDRSSKDLAQKYQKQINVEDNFIINKTNFVQNTLQEQKPKQLNKNLKNLIINKTIQQGNKQIKQIKTKYLTLDKSTKTKNSFFIQNQKNSQSDGLFKTIKKLNNFKYSASNLQIKLNQDLKSQNQKPGNSQFLPTNMQQIKQQINKFILSKRKVKPNINMTNQTLIEDENEVLLNIGQKHNQDSIAFKINKQLYNMSKFDNNVKIYQQTYDECQNQSNFYNNYPSDSNKSYPISQPIKYVICFKTCLIQLKKIVKVINFSDMADIQILVPKTLMNFQINSLRKDPDFFNHAKSLFESLGLPNSSLVIKKYSNCFLMVAKNICILIHNEGKIYLGGWNNKCLDEGTKHGLGLQWMPNQYIYYGEFSNSKKSGLGIMKNKNETFVGNWVEGKKVDGVIINQKGKIFHTRTLTNFEHPKFVQNYQNLESDPFM